ncbi:MAG: hypothetical protein ACAH80_02335 [Alphaproteobacteria bacterium]
MTSEPATAEKPPLSDSLFHVWRCLISLIMADGLYHQAERKFLDSAIRALEQAYVVTMDHRITFADDLREPQSIHDLLPKVTEPLHRVILPYFCEYISLLDGSQGQAEKDFVKQMREHLDTPDLKPQQVEFQKALAAKKAESRYFYPVDYLLQRLGIGRLE